MLRAFAPGFQPAAVLLGTLVSLGIWLTGYFFAERDWGLYRQTELDRHAALLHAQESHLSAAVQMVQSEFALIDSLLLDPVRRSAGQAPGWAGVQSGLQELMSRSRHWRSLSLLDAQGRVVASSHPMNLGHTITGTEAGWSRPLDAFLQLGTAFAARDWHDTAPEQPDAALLAAGRHALPMGQRLADVGGAPVFLVALVQSAFLFPSGQGDEDIRNGFGWMFDYQGRVLARSGSSPLHVGESHAELAPLEALRNERPFGSYALEAIGGPQPHTVQYRSARQLPVAVAIATSENALRQAWKARSVAVRWVPRLGAIAIFILSLMLAHLLWRRDQMAQALRISQRAAEASSAAKSAFLANISHELRTPLNSIIGMTQMALDHPSHPEQDGYLKAVRSSAQVLLRMVDQVLDFTRAESHALKLESNVFDLHRLCHQTMQVQQLAAADKGLRLTLAPLDGVAQWVRGDPMRLRQVLENLVENAIKFTDAGGVSVSVAAVGRRDKGTELRFDIEDTGIGISPEQQRLILEGFSQADASSTRRFGGVGLGLAMSHRLVRLMGGDIAISSTPGRGSRVSFTCLLGDVAPDQIPDPQAYERRYQPPAEAPVRPVRVLSVEDIAVNQQLVVMMLGKLGVGVDQAANGQQALEMARQTRYDLILMDLQMPVMDGVEATRQIRAHETAEGQTPVPIVALTAHGGTDDKRACEAVGMTGFLSKPATRADFERVLRTHTAWNAPPAAP